MSQFKGVPVNLPKAASGQQAPAESAALSITKEAQIYLDKQAVDKSALNDLLRQKIAKNPDLLVVINADDGVEHGRVVEIMDVARNANVAKLAIAVKPKEPKHKRSNTGQALIFVPIELPGISFPQRSGLHPLHRA